MLLVALVAPSALKRKGNVARQTAGTTADCRSQLSCCIQGQADGVGDSGNLYKYPIVAARVELGPIASDADE